MYTFSHSPFLSLTVCVCACVCLCVYVCVICMHLCIIYLSMHLFMTMCVCMCVCDCVYAHAYDSVCVCVCVHVYLLVCVCVHACVRAHRGRQSGWEDAGNAGRPQPAGCFSLGRLHGQQQTHPQVMHTERRGRGFKSTTRTQPRMFHCEEGECQVVYCAPSSLLMTSQHSR